MKQTDRLRDTDLTPCTEQRFGPKLLIKIIYCQLHTRRRPIKHRDQELVIAHMAWAKEKSATIGRAGAKTYIREMAK